MRYALLALTLAASALLPSSARGQDSALSTMGTLTVGQITTSGASATLLYSQQTGSTGIVRGVTTQTLFDAAGWGPLDTGVLTGLSLTGGLLSTTAQINGLLTTTGGIVTNSAAISGLLTTSGVTSVTASLTTLTTSGIGTFGGLVSTTGVFSGGITATGGVSSANTVVIRNGQNDKLQVGTPGNIFVQMNATSLTSYVSLYYGSGIALGTGATVDVGFLPIGGNTVKITNGTTGFGTIQTGGFAGNFRALAASGNITVTDNVVTLTGAITASLPSTSITGQQFIVKNIGGVNATVTVLGGTKTIDGSTTATIVFGAGKTSAMQFTYDGVNYIISE